MDLERLAEEKSPESLASGVQRIPRVSLFAMHFGEQRDRSRDSVAKAQVARSDIVSIDFGMEVDGYFADSAVTVPVGKIGPETQKLLDVTRESLDARLKDARRQPARRCRQRVQSWVEENGFSVVREFVGMESAPKCTTSPTCRLR